MSENEGGRYVALLRGINVGGRNKLPMVHLVSMVEEIGGLDARSYIQSGNLVFSAKPAIAARIPAALSASILKQYGFAVPVVMRSAVELRRIYRSNPFLERGADEGSLSVGFLADRPDARRLAALDPNRSPGDEFEVRGREVYLRLPNGAARSRLTNAYFDSTLGTITTFRNWRTTGKLVALVAE